MQLAALASTPLVADPKHEQHNDYIECAGDFDPKEFDARQATRACRIGGNDGGPPSIRHVMRLYVGGDIHVPNSESSQGLAFCRGQTGSEAFFNAASLCLTLVTAMDLRVASNGNNNCGGPNGCD